QDFLQNKRQAFHDVGKNFPVKQKRGESSDHEHQRQCLEGENEIRSGIRHHEWRCSAAEISKYKGRTIPGCRIQCDNDVVQAQKYSFKKRNIKQDTRDDKLHQDSQYNCGKTYLSPFFADCPCDAEEHENTE